MPCQKPQQLGVGMAVCRQDKDYTSNPIPTSLFCSKIAYPCSITRRMISAINNDVGMELLV